MSPNTLRTIVAIVLIAHGLGHALGALAAVGVRLSASHAPDSWLLTGLIGPGPTRAAGVIFWLASLGVFVAAGLALGGWWLDPVHWPALGLAAGVLSLVTVVVFWHGLPFFFPNKLGAILVDIAVLASLFGTSGPAPFVGS